MEFTNIPTRQVCSMIAWNRMPQMKVCQKCTRPSAHARNGLQAVARCQSPDCCAHRRLDCEVPLVTQRNFPNLKSNRKWLRQTSWRSKSHK